MLSRITCLVLFLSVSLSFATNASAQSSKEGDRLRARAEFLDGNNAYSKGEYAKALEHFAESLKLSGKKKLHYNLGLTHDRLRHDSKAVEQYKLYLDAFPKSDHRAEVEARVRAIEGSLAEKAAAEEARKRQDAALLEKERREKELQENLIRSQKEAEENKKKTGMWIGIGVGAGLAVAAGVIVIIAVASSSPQYKLGDFGQTTFALGSW